MLSQIYFILCGVNCILTLGKNEFLLLSRLCVCVSVCVCVCVVYTLGEDLYSTICVGKIFYSAFAVTSLGRKPY